MIPPRPPPLRKITHLSSASCSGWRSNVVDIASAMRVRRSVGSRLISGTCDLPFATPAVDAVAMRRDPAVVVHDVVTEGVAEDVVDGVLDQAVQPVVLTVLRVAVLLIQKVISDEHAKGLGPARSGLVLSHGPPS